MSDGAISASLASQLPPFADGLLEALRERLAKTAPARHGNHPELPLERLRLADQTLLRRFPQVARSLHLVYQIREARPALLYAGLVQEAINGWIEDRARAVGALLEQPRDGAAAPDPYIRALVGVSVPLPELYLCTLDLRNSYAHNVVPDDFIGPDEPALALCLLAYLLVAAVQMVSEGSYIPEFESDTILNPTRDQIDGDLESLTRSAFTQAAAALLKDPASGDAGEYLRQSLRPWHLPRKIESVSHLEGLRILTGRHVPRLEPHLSCSFNPPPSFTVHLQASVPWVYPLLDYADFLNRLSSDSSFEASFPGAGALNATFQGLLQSHVSWLLSRVPSA